MKSVEVSSGGLSDFRLLLSVSKLIGSGCVSKQALEKILLIYPGYRKELDNFDINFLRFFCNRSPVQAYHWWVFNCWSTWFSLCDHDILRSNHRRCSVNNRYFPVKSAKFLRTHIMKNICEQLLLHFQILDLDSWLMTQESFVGCSFLILFVDGLSSVYVRIIYWVVFP